MENIKVKKTNLLNVLKENRERHQKIFEEALEGFRKLAIEKLDESLTRAKAGQKFRIYFGLQEPVNQTKDYDRAIRMMELAVDEVIELSERDFQQYVMDDWNWKGQFLTTNSAYSVMAAQELRAESVD